MRQTETEAEAVAEAEAEADTDTETDRQKDMDRNSRVSAAPLKCHSYLFGGHVDGDGSKYDE